jgi:membrane associated rhomboid family serine protease
MTDSPRSESSPPDRGDTGEATPDVPTCYRHPSRESYIRCQRCGRYICPDCQKPAAVGFQCLECVREGARTTPATRTRFGGIVRGQGAIVTKVILGINVAVFLLALTGGAAQGWLALVGQPTFFAPEVGEATGVAGGAYWRLITAAFLHTQFWHIAVNMISLWVLGPMLETLLGRLRFAALYLVSALAGSAVAYAFTPPNVAIVGASGAIFGLFGATIVMARRMQADMRMFIPVIVVNIVLNVVFSSALSWQGHLGGFVAGFALGAILAYAPRERRDLVQGIGFAVVTLACIALIWWRTGQLSGSPFG